MWSLALSAVLSSTTAQAEPAHRLYTESMLAFATTRWDSRSAPRCIRVTA